MSKTKVCTRCGAEKELEDGFYKSREGKFGHTSYCKKCLITDEVEAYRNDPAVRMRHKNTRFRYRYGITLQEYENRCHEQDNRCAICKRSAKLVVDHDHACCPGETTCGNCIRGLICKTCNQGLGLFADTPEFLEEAARYLRTRK